MQNVSIGSAANQEKTASEPNPVSEGPQPIHLFPQPQATLTGTIVAFIVFAVLGIVGWEYIRGAWESKRSAYLWIRDHVRWWGL